MNRLREWAKKIDELSLRERGLAFVVAAVSLVIIVHAAALQPLLRQQRGYLERIRQNEGQLRAVSEALVKSAGAVKDDPLAPKRERVRELTQRRAAAEKLLSTKRSGEATPEQVTELLRNVLGRNRSVRILALRVLPPATISATPGPAGQAPAGGPPSVSRPSPATSFYRYAVEIEMSGGYLELLKYLGDVEALPWRLGWERLELKTTDYPEVQLRATLFTVSSSQSLLEFTPGENRTPEKKAD